MSPRVGVVIPARDEAERIDACLVSVRAAIARAGVDAVVVVVADGCLDDTAARARAHAGVTVLESDGTNVGTARALGCQAALAAGADWLASTDADSIVPTDWLSVQLQLAAEGADVVVGTVRPDFRELTAEQVDAWRRTHGGGQALGHIHGANLGIRAATYRAAGGYRPLPEHEDTDLVERLRAHGAVVPTERGEVTTSGRSVGRTPGGYARYLRDDLLLAAQSAGATPTADAPTAA